MRFLSYQQRLGGIPVLGGKRVVTDAPGRRADLVVDHTRVGLAPPRPASVSRATALRTAKARVGSVAYRARPSAALAILPRAPRGLLVWRVVLPASVPLGSFEVLVDAHSSQVLRVRDLLRRATGLASIFEPDPVEKHGGRSDLADNDDADSQLLTDLRTPVTLQRMTADCLAGQWVKAVLPAGDPAASTPAGDVCLASRDWSAVTRSDNRFEALTAYFNIDRNQEYIRSLGFTNVVSRQFQINVDDVDTFPPGEEDNSYYDPATGQITLGEGGVDDGEDSDVMNHEYGHAIQDSQVAGFGDGQDAGALGEGFSDYFAANISATYSPNPSFDTCIAEWDGVGFSPPFDCLRDVNLKPTVAQMLAPPCSGEVHCLGEVWSGALWSLRETYGPVVATRVAIQSHFSLTLNASFQDASAALIAADRALYGGAHEAFLRTLLSSRGLVNLERLDDTIAGSTPLAVPGSVTGSIDTGSDPHDVYRLSLTARRALVVRGSSGADIDLRLYGPGSSTLFDGVIVSGSTTAGNGTEAFDFGVSTSGVYYLDVEAASGAGSYTITTQSIADTDADGVADPSDNCPTVSNRSQGDWNKNGKGNACDRSALVRVSSVSVQRRVVVRFTARVYPRDVRMSRWQLFSRRQVCARVCRYGRAKALGGTRRTAPGVIQLTFRLSKAGRYRLQAVLRDPRYDNAKSAFKTLRIKKAKRRR